MAHTLVQILQANARPLQIDWTRVLAVEFSQPGVKVKLELESLVRELWDAMIRHLTRQELATLESRFDTLTSELCKQHLNLFLIEKIFLSGLETITNFFAKIYAHAPAEYIQAQRLVEHTLLNLLLKFSELYEQKQQKFIKVNSRKLARTEARLKYCQKLHQEHQKLEGILEAMGTGLFLIDRQYRILWYNRFLAHELHLPRKSPFSSCYQTYWQRSQPCEGCLLERTFETGKVTRTLMTRRDPNNGLHYYQIIGIPVTNEQREVVSVLELLQDITETKTLENQLLQAERFTSLGKLAAKVAHEIRNPLSSMSLNLELLEDEINGFVRHDATEARTLLSAIQSEIERLALFTDEYLQFYRLPSPIFESSNINQLIQHLLQFLNHELATQRIQIKKELDAALTAVEIDQKQLRQALLNLLRNSIEAMPQGGEIYIRTQQLNGSVEITFQDNGHGIPITAQPHIFDLFYSTKEGGTGLGLSLTQQIIKEHGGCIYCVNGEQTGAKFMIRLPIRQLKRD
ncbi:ATP-binding protein [candidate division KSB1 bacterium]|nr:ATP-binding protein [candidate division KSB1 bacterium]